MQATDRRSRFEAIYSTNGWNGPETPSGPGSTLGATAMLRTELPKLIADLGATAVLDAGCGTGLWIPDLPGYVGIDLVAEALSVAAAQHPDRTYVLGDICADRLPDCDLVICRDTLQHLSFADGRAAMANFRAAGAQWLIATTHMGETNRNIESGGWFPVNMEAAPFNLSDRRLLFADGQWDAGTWRADKRLGCWAL